MLLFCMLFAFTQMPEVVQVSGRYTKLCMFNHKLKYAGNSCIAACLHLMFPAVESRHALVSSGSSLFCSCFEDLNHSAGSHSI